jgi:nitrite reductase/ring-hydroxylating ferredoxin subunit
MTRWLELGALDELAEGRPVLRKVEGIRLACVRQGEIVHALDDRCPHQGYPLSQGTLNGGVLTCQWHNWKFETSTGECTFGGEPVRRYPTRVEGGRVYLDVAVDERAELDRLSRSLRTALFESEVGRAVRDGLRIAALAGHTGASVLPALGIMAADGAARAPWGFDHPLAVLADLCSWTERGWLGGAEALGLAATAIGETNQARPPRERPPPVAPEGEGAVRADLLAEHRARAESSVRWLTRERGAVVAAAAMTPFAAEHLYDYGHGAIFLAKAEELSRRFPDAAEEVLASACAMLAWATAETSLPPFAATRAALEALGGGDGRTASARESGFDRTAFEAAVLEGERTGVAAVLERLAEGCAPQALLRAIAHAAAVRLGRFDPAWETRLEAEVGVLDVTHAVTFAESALALCASAAPEVGARLAVIGAGFVGKLRRADVTETAPCSPRLGGDLNAALRDRDVAAAHGAVVGMGPAERLDVYSRLAPFAALEAAVRPIFFAHTIKNTEALWRLERDDPEADGAYMRALVTYLVPRRRERNIPRVATVARAFLRTGRPPEGLY